MAKEVAFIQVDHSVQDLAGRLKDAGGHVPERFIRPEMDDTVVIVPTEYGSAGEELPVVDLSRLLDPSFSETEIAKLRVACHNWGFFQLTNHGVDPELIERMKTDIAGFFSLPLEEKRKVAIPAGGMQGYGHHFIMSEDQKLDWGDMLFLAVSPPENRDMRFWPINPPNFRNTLDEYTSELQKLARFLLEFMAKALGLQEPETLLDLFKVMPHGVRINYYPPCSCADKVVGLSPHTDGNGFTLLLQANDVQGLQINKDGKWHPVRNLPGALVINVGDALEVFSNGEFKSIEHRAVVNTEKERMSIATFIGQDPTCKVGPIAELVDRGSRARYKSIDCIEYAKGYLAAKLEGRRYMESLKLPGN